MSSLPATTRRRRRFAALALVAAIGLIATACSGGSDTAQRSAAAADIDTTGFANPIGDPNTSTDPAKWCLRPQDSDGAEGFYWVRNITLCNVMTNLTRKFTAPGVLDGRFPLGVTKALCSYSDETCKSEGGPYYGAIRSEGVDASNVEMKGDRNTYPNPFLGTAAVQFMPNKIWQGTTTRTYVGSNMAPYSLSQQQAELFGELPTTGTNYYNCTNGEYITCRITGGNTQDSNVRVRWSLGNLPLQIQVNNNSGRTMTQQSDPVQGSGFLIDAAGTSSQEALRTIPTGRSVFVGGYRNARSDAGHSWTANYCIDSLAGCVPVAITVQLVKESDKWVSKSTCVVSPRTGTTTYKCNTPTVNESDDYRQAVVNITDF